MIVSTISILQGPSRMIIFESRSNWGGAWSRLKGRVSDVGQLEMNYV